MKTLEQQILAQLAVGPRSGRYLQATLTFGPGDGKKPAAQSVTNARNLLVKQGDVIATELPLRGSRGWPRRIYSLRPLDGQAKARLIESYRLRDRVLDGLALGKAGQDYVYGLFYRAKLFRMHRKDRLGKIRRSKTGGQADLLLKLKDYHPALDRILIEVKNEFQTFNASSEELLEVIHKALHFRALPVLIAPHFSKTAEEVCATVGIATLRLRRQLVPRSHSKSQRVKKEVKSLIAAGIISPYEPMEFINPKRFYQHKDLSEPAKADLEIVADPLWLEAATVTWEVNYTDAREALYKGQDWPTIRREIERQVAEVTKYGARVDEPEFYERKKPGRVGFPHRWRC